MNDVVQGSNEPSLDWALSRIRHYAEEHKLTPGEVCDTFTLGIGAKARGEKVYPGHIPPHPIPAPAPIPGLKAT